MSCHVEDHRTVWDRIEPGMLALYQEYPVQDWTVDSVRSMLDAGRMLLVIDEEEPAAFAVVYVNECPYKSVESADSPNELELFLYLARHPGGEAFARFQPYLEDIARCAGARFIRFRSRRRGMERLAASVGYTQGSVEFLKEV